MTDSRPSEEKRFYSPGSKTPNPKPPKCQAEPDDPFYVALCVIGFCCAMIFAIVLGAVSIQEDLKREQLRNRSHHIQLIFDGVTVKAWDSVGEVIHDSGDYRFLDKKTGELVHVSGSVIVTRSGDK